MVVHANLDLVDGPAVPEYGRTVVRKSGAGAEVDIIPLGLGRPIVSQVKFAAEADEPASPMTGRGKTVGRLICLVEAGGKDPWRKRAVVGSENARGVDIVVSPGATDLREYERPLPRISDAGGRR